MSGEEGACLEPASNSTRPRSSSEVPPLATRTARAPTIEWQTNGICNYDCTYCIQSKKFRVGQPEEAQIEAFLHFFASLPGPWEIKMSGGEPFANRHLMSHIVPGLMATPHALSILTNLSAPVGVLEKFAALTHGRLKVVSMSLHREFTSVDAFLERARRLRAGVAQGTSLVVNAVVVPGQVQTLLEVRSQVESAGFRFFPQLMKTKKGVTEYAAEEQSALATLLGPRPGPREANLAPSYFGKRCWAGVDYLVLAQNGDAFSCRTAKRFGEGYLGNVFEGTVQRWTLSRHCPYEICPCTVPVHRGMIELEDSSPLEEADE